MRRSVSKRPLRAKKVVHSTGNQCFIDDPHDSGSYYFD
jgi:hypothetical protein